MKRFENVYGLVQSVYEMLDEDESVVSVVANKELTVEIMKEMLESDNIILDFAEIDDRDYDREYLLSLYEDEDDDYWHISIEQIYDYENNRYFATDGYVLFHEDVNSKALTDMQSNKNAELSGYDWFIIGEDDCEDDCECHSCKRCDNDTNESESTYVSRDKNGTPIGFQKTWYTKENGVDYYSSYSHYTSDLDMLKEIAEEFGVNL